MVTITATIIRTATITMLDYEFMRNAFAAAGIAAIVSGLVGYFLVLRGQTFAGHALSHVGFTGATGAVLVGVPPLWGLVGFTLLATIDRTLSRSPAFGLASALARAKRSCRLDSFMASSSRCARDVSRRRRRTRHAASPRPSTRCRCFMMPSCAT